MWELAKVKSVQDFADKYSFSTLLRRNASDMLQMVPRSMRLRPFRHWYRYRYWRYPGIGDPFQVYTVDPEDIRHSVSSSILDWKTPLFGIQDGSWDIQAREISSNNMWFKHWRDGVAWEETEGYQRIYDRLKRGGSFGHLDVPPKEQDPEDWDEYLSYLDGLYESIKENGYKTQAELLAEGKSTDAMHPVLNEIQVFIGRDGKLMVRTGRHRLYIAQCLSLDSIPVRTRVRHTGWQQKRDKISQAESRESLKNSYEEYLDHPEVKDILQ